MKKYFLVMKLALEAEMEYRMNFFVSLPGLFAPIIVNAFFWVAVYTNSSEPRLYSLTLQEMFVYIVVSNLIYFFISAKFTKDIAGDIRSGTLSNYIVKPVSYIFYQFFKHIGAKIVSYVMFALFAGVFFFLASVNYIIVLSPGRFILFVFSLLLSSMLNYLLFYCISVCCFWIVDALYIFDSVEQVIRLLSGSIIPLHVFGNGFMRISSFLPFQYITYFPTQIIVGAMPADIIAFGFIMQGAWIIGLGLLLVCLWNRGLKKYVAVGG